MDKSSEHDSWSAGQSYENYMGRWSREVAGEFLDWLDQPAGLDWLDVGCGTGALSATILARCAPRSVLGVDPSDRFVSHAREGIVDGRVRFEVAGAESLPCADDSADVVASALVYNFIPDRAGALAEMGRVAKPRGTVSFYVWDYPSGGTGFLRAFWDAAISLDPSAEALAEDRRFPFCTRERLLHEVAAAGLADAVVQAIELSTRWDNFEEFWQPFTLGAGPAPGYCMALSANARLALKQRLMDDLGTDGPIEFPARAWAVRGRAP